MKALHLTSETFKSTIANATQPVLVDFWAEWCGPCKMLGPVIDEIAGEQEGKAVVAKLDIDGASEIAAEYGISAIPTLIVFRNGQAVKTLRGVQSKSAITAALNA